MVRECDGVKFVNATDIDKKCVVIKTAQNNQTLSTFPNIIECD